MSKSSTPRINKVLVSTLWEIQSQEKFYWKNLKFFYFFYHFFTSFYTQLNVANISFWNFNFFNKFFYEPTDSNGFYQNYYTDISSMYRAFNKSLFYYNAWKRQLFRPGTCYIYEWDSKLILFSIYLKGSIYKYKLNMFTSARQKRWFPLRMTLKTLNQFNYTEISFSTNAIKRFQHYETENLKALFPLNRNFKKLNIKFSASEFNWKYLKRTNTFF